MKIRALGALALVLLAGCGEPSYGEMPALCAADGACPDGYDCIHGVCATPGTPVPITVANVFTLRSVDMRMVPQAKSVLLTWQTYAYSEEGQRFVGARVTREGKVSPRMDIVGRFVAGNDSLEPYFDVLPVENDRLLVAISAPSLPNDPSPKPRLITYRVDLPPEGNEGSPLAFEAAWPEEKRLDTVGYCAVSLPRLLDRGDAVDLGYVRSRNTALDTVAELSVFSMQRDGTLKAPEPNDYAARTGLSVAVGVFDAFDFGLGSWWVWDDERPSALYLLEDGSGKRAEARLERLSVPVALDGTALLYIKPSERTGDKLASSLVTGAAELHRVSAIDAGGVLQIEDIQIGTLPVIRDTPRPAWIAREGKDAILITPGEDALSPNLLVYLVEPLTGVVTLSSTIPRYSNL